MSDQYVIYHHDDPDGHCAGGIMIRHLIDHLKVDQNHIYYTPKNYGSQFNNHFGLIENNNDRFHFYLVDLSFTEKTKSELEEILAWENTAEVVWIDHHASSAPVMESLTNDKLTKIFSTDACGALLTYAYYCAYKVPDNFPIGINLCTVQTQNAGRILTYAGSDNFVYGIVKDCNKNPIVISDFLYHLDAYDRWTKEDPDADAFIAGLKLADYHCNARNSMNSDGLYLIRNIMNDSNTAAIVNNGRICLGYQYKLMEEQEDKIGMWEIGGVKIVYKNAVGNSYNFCKYLENKPTDFMYADFGLLGSYSPDIEKFTYSLYKNPNSTKDIQANKICELFGGGGHPGAAGFQSKECFFEDYKQWDTNWFAANYPEVIKMITGEDPEANICDNTANICDDHNIAKDSEVVKPLIFLGGTVDIVNHINWRDLMKKYLGDLVFDPVVEEWDDEARKHEEEMKKICKYHLYVIFLENRNKNFYSIMEIGYDLNTYPEHTRIIFVDRNPIYETIKDEFRDVDIDIVSDDRMLAFRLGEIAATVMKDIKDNK